MTKKFNRDLKRFFWKFKNIFHRYTKEEKQTIKTNKKLIERFPFLLPKNRFSLLMSYDYDYTHTELDALPKAWRNSFGIEMCEKIKACLIKANYLDKYFITQIKEKYGILHWYDMGVPQSIHQEYHDIINYYEDKSMLVCIETGKTAKYMTLGWFTYISEESLKQKLKEYPEFKNQYLELTWSFIPYRESYLFNNKRKTVKESKLKGEMMMTWKRHSKHNKLIEQQKENTSETENVAENVAKTGLW